MLKPRSLILFICLILITNKLSAQSFVTVKNQQFIVDGKPYYFIGTNYWYGGLLALVNDDKKGKQRLIKELDFLKSKGVNNLRVLAGSEGEGKINGVDRVKPTLQTKHGVYNKEILEGLDFLLDEMAKRKMYAVLYFSNNWEWSGGFLQYLNWNNQTDLATMQKKMSWDELRDETSKFYSCQSCKDDYLKQVDYILDHTNIYNGKKYVDDPTIMTWELANEPRPMRSRAVEAYKQWIKDVVNHVDTKAPKQLITIGTEGSMGTEDSIDLWKQIHINEKVDYTTIHIWPKNWSFFQGTDIKSSMDNILNKTKDYINIHNKVSKEIAKPLVLEEFGLPRDNHTFTTGTSTAYRDRLYQMVFNVVKDNATENGAVAGLNFWGFGGNALPIPGQIFWKDGDDFMGDPPQEEQGLNTVFDSDKSTWKLIKKYSSALKKIVK